MSKGFRGNHEAEFARPYGSRVGWDDSTVLVRVFENSSVSVGCRTCTHKVLPSLAVFLIARKYVRT